MSYPPGGKTPPHHHARSAFVTGYVLSGSIRSQVDDGKVPVVHAGESWSEAPGAHHPISENASATEPAKRLAIFVVDTDDKETLEQAVRFPTTTPLGAPWIARGVHAPRSHAQVDTDPANWKCS